MDPALREVLRKGASDEIEAIIRLDGTGRVPADVRLVARFGDVATCRMPRSRVSEVWAESSVISLKAPRAFGLDPHIPDCEAGDGPQEGVGEAEGEHGARRRFGLAGGPTGRGVIVAVIDWGIDFAHANFRKPDGRTRLRAVWHQGGRGASPAPYGYGVVFDQNAIDAALEAPSPYAALGYHPGVSDRGGRGAHGTHVMDIAAGGGLAPGSIAGVAPEAGLLFVHLAMRGVEERRNLGDSVTLLEAIDWVRRWTDVNAPGSALVINLSVGRHGGPHNGLTPVERAMDWFLRERPGRAIAQSCGNYFRTRTHAHLRLREGRPRSVRWLLKPGDLTPNELEVWYPPGDILRLSLTAPGGETVTAALGEDRPVPAGGRIVGHLYHRATDPAAGDNHINVFLDAAAPSGEWTVRLEPREVRSGETHLWVERDGGCGSCQSEFHPDDASQETTTNTICNGHLTLATGAAGMGPDEPAPAPFSSAGPTRDGRSKPDLAAPGVRISAARSAPASAAAPTHALVSQSGTSMASPHVAGLVALMFEAAGRKLSIAETRAALLAACRPLGEPAAFRAGAGLVDAQAAIAEARRLAGRNPSEASEAEAFIADEADAQGASILFQWPAEDSGFSGFTNVDDAALEEATP